jgi:hypothetical protein
MKTPGPRPGKPEFLKRCLIDTHEQQFGRGGLFASENIECIQNVILNTGKERGESKGDEQDAAECPQDQAASQRLLEIEQVHGVIAGPL